jgi:hypothetical protein
MKILCPKCGTALEGEVNPRDAVACPSCGLSFSAGAPAAAFAPDPVPPRKGSLVRGIVGAALGAFFGALLWALVGMLGYIAAIIGLAIAWLVTFGYDHAGGPEGAVRVVVVLVAIVASVVFANAIQVEYEIRTSYRDALANLDGEIAAAIREDPDLAKLDDAARAEAAAAMREEAEVLACGEYRSEVLADPEVRGEVLKNLGMGLLFALAGGAGFLRRKRDA